MPGNSQFSVIDHLCLLLFRCKTINKRRQKTELKQEREREREKEREIGGHNEKREDSASLFHHAATRVPSVSYRKDMQSTGKRSYGNGTIPDAIDVSLRLTFFRGRTRSFPRSEEKDYWSPNRESNCYELTL